LLSYSWHVRLNPLKPSPPSHSCVWCEQYVCECEFEMYEFSNCKSSADALARVATGGCGEHPRRCGHGLSFPMDPHPSPLPRPINGGCLEYVGVLLERSGSVGARAFPSLPLSLPPLSPPRYGMFTCRSHGIGPSLCAHSPIVISICTRGDDLRRTTGGGACSKVCLESCPTCDVTREYTGSAPLRFAYYSARRNAPPLPPYPPSPHARTHARTHILSFVMRMHGHAVTHVHTGPVFGVPMTHSGAHSSRVTWVCSKQ
jgi:hypothetical protein